MSQSTNCRLFDNVFPLISARTYELQKITCNAKKEITSMKITSDPSILLRYRDSIYATDLLICVIAHFDLFTSMVEKQTDFLTTCKDHGIHDRPAQVMLSLFLSMNLLEAQNHNKFFLTDIARQYLTSTSRDTLVPYYSSLKNRPPCLEFRNILLTDKPAGWSSKKGGQDWITSMRNPDFADSFTSAMDSRGRFLAKELANNIDLSRYHSILDIAGASGVYACAFSNTNPQLRSSILEISPVDEAALRSIKEKNMENVVSVIQGNMFEFLPQGFDVHLLANTLHDWNIESNRTIISNSFKSLPSGGCIIVFDAHLNDDLNGPLSVAEYSCLLMHSTEGRCYSKKEIRDLLISTGFVDTKEARLPADRSVIIAHKP